MASPGNRGGYRGRVLDLDTGELRRDHVLVQSTAIGEVFIGLGKGGKRLLDFAFDGKTDADPRFATWDKIDRALRRNEHDTPDQTGADEALARIAAPPLRRLAIAETMLGKASPDDPDHPGWPAGTSGSRGGQFRPKDETEAAKKKTKEDALRLGARQKLRTAIVDGLKIAITLPFDAVPGVDGASVPMTLLEIAQTAIDLGNDQKEVDATVDFIENGPYTLDDLRVSPESVSFSSYDAFRKFIDITTLAWIKQYSRAGDGIEYHHIVTQGGDNASQIPAEELQSTDNIIKLPAIVHELVHQKYSAPSAENPKLTVYQWLQTQPYDVQRARGIEILQKLGILK